MNVSLHEIKNMSKEKFKKQVQQTVESAAFQWLSHKKSNSKKVKDIHHGRLEIQKYLSQPVLSNFQTKLLFSLRAKMIFVRENYPNMQNDKSCPLCSTVENKLSDNQEHLLECIILNSGSSDIREQEMSYSDIFSENQDKQAKVTLVLETKYNQRKRLLDNK